LELDFEFWDSTLTLEFEFGLKLLDWIVLRFWDWTLTLRLEFDFGIGL